MPFTGSHPAIILPLLRLRIFSFSGLIMGSMVPDFEFFLRLDVHIVYGHSLLPIFWLNIPTALFCITIYHSLIRNVLIVNLPVYFQRKFQPFLNFNWFGYLKSNFFKVILSIIIGNLSHLFWDQFTHSYGLFVNIFSYSEIRYYQIPLYDLLQYLFSILGAISILYFISKMPNFDCKKQLTTKKLLPYWITIITITLLVYFLRYDVTDYHKFTSKIVFLCAGFLVGLCITSVLFRAKEFLNISNASNQNRKSLNSEVVD